MRPDGTGERDLLSGGSAPWPQWDPAWSPDGTRIAFRGYYGLGDGQYDLYVVDANGCHLTRLTHGLNGTSPSWSPSGNEIAFSVGGVDVIKPDGTGLHHLTRDTSTSVDDAPSWSTTNRIAFVRYPTHHAFGLHFGEVYVMNADGSGVRAMTRSGPGFGEPSWSPDGRQVAAVAYPGQAAVIDVINSDGSGLHRISPVTWKSFSPTWTPDGHVIFLVKRKAGIDAYIANPGGSGLRLLYSNLMDPLQIEWGPAHLPQPECRPA
jgi:TolB protein